MGGATWVTVTTEPMSDRSIPIASPNDDMFFSLFCDWLLDARAESSNACKSSLWKLARLEVAALDS